MVVLVLFSMRINAQKPMKFDRSVEVKLMDDSLGKYTYGVSDELITNRDYITYILWKMAVMGPDYPSGVLDAFPGYETIKSNDYYTNKEIDKYYYSTSKFHYMMKHSEWFVQDYIFNVKYIDYPVIGISKKQASKFNQWLSDRYNENLLIKKGFQKINFYQVNEDNFVTDSYLANQYYGRARLDSSIQWKDEVLVNNFRLPTKKEVGEMKVELKKQNSKPFLKYLQDSLFAVKRDGIEIKLKYPNINKKAKKFISKPSADVKLKLINISEMFLSDSVGSYQAAFEKNGYPILPHSSFKDAEGYEYEKDSLGLMNYVVIGRDIKNERILIQEDGYHRMADHYLHPNKEFQVFRYAVTIKHE